MKTIYLMTTLILIFNSCRKNESKPPEESANKAFETAPSSVTEDSLYKAKFTEESGKIYDSLMSISDFGEDLYAFVGFDYPEFEVKSESESEMILTKGDKQVVIKSSTFDANDKKIIHSEYGPLVINGKPIYGTDGNIPKDEISDFYLVINGKKISVPKEQYEDLYEPNLKCHKDENGQSSCYITAYEKENGEIIVIMLNSDAAGSYEVIFFFNPKGEFKNRVIGNPV